MLYLFMAVVSSALVSILMRLSEKYVRLSGAAMKLGGVLIPIIAAVLLIQERMKRAQFAGAVLAVAAIVLINAEKGKFNIGGKKRWLVVLLLSLGRVPAVIAYPVFSVGTTIVISMADAVFFMRGSTGVRKARCC